jgi:hypothetical protein
LHAQPDEDLLRRAERIRGNPFLLVDFTRGFVEERWSRWSLTEQRVMAESDEDPEDF